MIESTAREEIRRVGRSLFERGYAHATAGNISVRTDDGFLITPTDACLGFLEAGELAHVDPEGRSIGPGRPSKTLAMHRRIYDATGARCILHTHSTHCVALTLQPTGPELLLPITPYFVMKVGHVPVIPYHRPGDPAAAERIARVVAEYARRGTPVRAVMLERLGPVVWHDSPAQAMAVLEELEETAKLWLLSDPRPSPLPAPAIAELCETFGANW